MLRTKRSRSLPMSYAVLLAYSIDTYIPFLLLQIFQNSFLNNMKNLICVFFMVIAVLSCISCKQRVDVQNVREECDLSIFHGLKPSMKEADFFAVLGAPNDWLDGKDKDGEKKHCPIYYFDDHKIMGCWDGEWPEIGVIEFIPYYNNSYTIDQFLSNPTKYGIDENTKRFDIYSNDIWWFEVYLNKYRVDKIQFWNEE